MHRLEHDKTTCAPLQAMAGRVHNKQNNKQHVHKSRLCVVYRCVSKVSPYWKRVCMRSKAWPAPSVWLRLARLPPPASRVRRSRRLRDTLAAAPGLVAHTLVTRTPSMGGGGNN